MKLTVQTHNLGPKFQGANFFNHVKKRRLYYIVSSCDGQQVELVKIVWLCSLLLSGSSPDVRLPVHDDSCIEWEYGSHRRIRYLNTKNVSNVREVKLFPIGQNFDFWPKFRFLLKILIFGQNFDFQPKFRFLLKILIFGQNFDFCSKFRFLLKILIFGLNCDFCSKF